MLSAWRYINCLNLSVSRNDCAQSCLCFLKIIKRGKDHETKDNSSPPGTNKVDRETSEMFDKLCDDQMITA